VSMSLLVPAAESAAAACEQRGAASSCSLFFFPLGKFFFPVEVGVCVGMRDGTQG